METHGDSYGDGMNWMVKNYKSVGCLSVCLSGAEISGLAHVLFVIVMPYLIFFLTTQKKKTRGQC